MIAEISAGIIPLRFNNALLGESPEYYAKHFLESAMVYVVQLRSGNHYSFPKGHVERGEELYEAAQRELYEETCLEVKELLLARTFEEIYIVKREAREIKKKVVFFVAEVEGDPKIDPAEIIEGKWVQLNEVEKQLTYTTSKKTFVEVMAALKAKYHTHS